MIRNLKFFSLGFFYCFNFFSVIIISNRFVGYLRALLMEKMGEKERENASRDFWSGSLGTDPMWLRGGERERERRRESEGTTRKGKRETLKLR